MSHIKSLPPRAVLEPLVPIGAQTDRVESLTSYITRLAAGNLVSVSKLIYKLVLPQIPIKNTNSQISNVGWSDSHLVNGMGQTASDWVFALNVLTGRTDLAQLTFLPWVDTLPTKISLVCRHRRWCPECLDEMLESGTAIHERLIWTVNSLQLCPWHLTKLEACCPACGHRHCSELPGRRLAGFCSRCFAWLGKASYESRFQPNDSAYYYRAWVAKGFSLLLNRTPISEAAVDSKRLARMITAGVELRCDGVSAEFAMKIKRMKSVVTQWQKFQVVPSIQSLAEISYVFQIPFDCLIYCEQHAWNYSTINRILPTSRQIKRAPSIHDRDKNRRILEEIVDGGHETLMTFRAVAKSLCIDQRFLRRQFPELARKVASECKARRKTLFERRAQEKMNLLFCAALDVARVLQKSGEYPSRKKIIAELSLQGVWLDRRHSPLLRNVQKRLEREVDGLELKGR